MKLLTLLSQLSYIQCLINCVFDAKNELIGKSYFLEITRFVVKIEFIVGFSKFILSLIVFFLYRLTEFLVFGRHHSGSHTT